MSKSLVISFLVFVGALGPWSAAAQDCQYINLKVDFRSFALVDPPPIPPYDYDLCIEYGKITGNLNGKYTFCVYFADFSVSSDSIYGDGLVQVKPGKYASRITTRNGTIDFAERSWWDGDFNIETGFAKALGGTGSFGGAIGSLFWQGPRFPIPGQNFLFPFEGYICAP